MPHEIDSDEANAAREQWQNVSAVTFTPVTPDLYVCSTCGAVVTKASQATHAAWHKKVVQLP